LSGILKIKSLWIGLFLALPLAAALKLSGHHHQEPSAPAKASNVVETSLVKIPVEVVAKSGKTEWVMVEVPVQPIPEPGIATLLMAFSCLCLLRRKREE
jgi:hypothetical protein